MTYIAIEIPSTSIIKSEICKHCGKFIVPGGYSKSGYNNSISVIVGYGHWDDDLEEKNFCSDKCVIAYFIKANNDEKVYATETVETEEELRQLIWDGK